MINQADDDISNKNNDTSKKIMINQAKIRHDWLYMGMKAVSRHVNKTNMAQAVRRRV